VFSDPKYIQASYNLIIPIQQEIRKKDHDFEDMLKGKYHQPQIVPVPDELDPDVPRMIFGSKHGYSQLVVTQNKLSLNVRFSQDEWQSDITKGDQYLNERVSLLFAMVQIIGDIEPYYSGCSVNVLTRSDSEDDVYEVLSRFDIMNSRSERELNDVNVKNAYIVDNKYYSNLSLKNYRTWQLNKGGDSTPSLPRDAASDCGLEIINDFNDRYSYNEDSSYRTTIEKAPGIISGCIGSIGDLLNYLKIKP
jgi:hypothetical protein